MSTTLRLNLSNLSLWNRLRICFFILFKGGFAMGGLDGGPNETPTPKEFRS